MTDLYNEDSEEKEQKRSVSFTKLANDTKEFIKQRDNMIVIAVVLSIVLVTLFILLYLRNRQKTVSTHINQLRSKIDSISRHDSVKSMNEIQQTSLIQALSGWSRTNADNLKQDNIISRIPDVPGHVIESSVKNISTSIEHDIGTISSILIKSEDSPMLEDDYSNIKTTLSLVMSKIAFIEQLVPPNMFSQMCGFDLNEMKTKIVAFTSISKSIRLKKR